MYNTAANKTKALHDIKVFAELIKFHGGWSKFGLVHKKLVGFVTAPQTAKPCTTLTRGKEKLVYNNRRVVLMPRGHLKSTVCSVLYVLWRIYRNPNIRILVGCNKLELSQAFIRELRQYLEDPELQLRVWNARPHIQGKLVPEMDAAGRKRRAKKSEDDDTEAEDKKVIWTLAAIQVLRDEKLREPTVLATSVGTRVTGQHYDLLILDDVVDFDNVSTPQKVSKTFEWCQDMESVLDPPREIAYGKVGNTVLKEKIGDEVVVLGTRYDIEDYYASLIANLKEWEYKLFTKNIYRNGVDSRAGYIWPEKFNDEYVRKLRARTTARRWASQYLNTIISDEESILKLDKVRYYASRNVEKKGHLVEIRLAEEKTTRVIRPFLVVDPAVSQKDTADNTVLTVGGMDENGDLFVLQTMIGKFTPAQTVENIFTLCKTWGLNSVSVETNGVGAHLPYSIREQFKNYFPIVIREIRHGRESGAKKERLESQLQPLFENQKLFLPDFLANHEVVNNEIMFFPRETAKDDFLDTLFMLCEVCIKTPRNFKGTNTKPKRAYNSKYGGSR